MWVIFQTGWIITWDARDHIHMIMILILILRHCGIHLRSSGGECSGGHPGYSLHHAYITYFAPNATTPDATASGDRSYKSRSQPIEISSVSHDSHSPRSFARTPQSGHSYISHCSISTLGRIRINKKCSVIYLRWQSWWIPSMYDMDCERNILILITTLQIESVTNAQ